MLRRPSSFADAHRPVEETKMRVEGVWPIRRLRRLFMTNEDHATGLISRDQQAAVQLPEDIRQIAGVDAGQRVFLRHSRRT